MAQDKGFKNFLLWTIYKAKEGDFKKYRFVFSFVRILVCIVTVVLLIIKFISPFSIFINEWWGWMITIIIVYFIFRLYWEMIKAVWKFLNKYIWRKFLRDILKWLIFLFKEQDFKRYNWVFATLRILAMIIGMSLIITYPHDIHEHYKEHGNLSLIDIVLIYLIIRIYWEWIKAIWKFLKEDVIVHYIFLILIPIGIIIGGYHLFLDDLYIPSLGIISNADFLGENRLTVEKLNGFYASLFTAIAVIGAIVGLAGWRKIKESMEQVKTIKEIKDDIEFIHEKRKHTEWIEKKFKDISNQNLESLDLSSTEDREELKKIENHVTKDITGCSWLELIYAYNLIDKECSDFEIRKQNLAQAQKILEYLDYRIIPDKSYLETQMRHIKGQLYWNKYLHNSSKYNFFMSDSDDFKKYKSDEIKNACVQALKCLETASDSYKILLDNVNVYSRKMNIDEAKGNYAMILIELYKHDNTQKIKNGKIDKVYDDVFKRISKNHQIEYLTLPTKIRGLFKEIKDSTFNHQWDIARMKYYKWLFNKNDLKSEEDFQKYKMSPEELKKIQDNFLNEMMDKILKSEKIDEKLFRKQIDKEQKEFHGNGFPGHTDIVKDLKNEVKIVI